MFDFERKTWWEDDSHFLWPDFETLDISLSSVLCWQSWHVFMTFLEHPFGHLLYCDFACYLNYVTKSGRNQMGPLKSHCTKWDFLKDFFLKWSILKVFIECVTVLLLLFICWVFGPWDMWGLSSPTKDRTLPPCTGRRSLNHWTPRKTLVACF